MKKEGKGIVIFFLLIGVIIALFFLFTQEDGQPAQWTQERRENALYFINSINLVVEATEISQRAGFGALSKEKTGQIKALWQEALYNAEKVSDRVLELIHPEMKEQYRNNFERGLKLRLQNLDSTDGNVGAEIEGSRLLGKWGDWYNKNMGAFRIPKP